MTDDELMDMARPLAADGGRWPSDWLSAMRAAASAEREACAKVCDEIANAEEPYDFAIDAVNAAGAAIRMRSNVELDVCEQKLQYFKALAQRLCKHQWVALESKDGTVSKFCPVCTLVKDDI